MTEPKETEETKSKPADELTVIRSMLTLLKKLSPAGQARVVEYLRARSAEPVAPANGKAKDLFE